MIEAILRSTATGLLVLLILWLLRQGPARRRVIAARIGLVAIVLAAVGVRFELPSFEAPLVVAQGAATLQGSSTSPNYFPFGIWVLGAVIASLPLLTGALRLRRLWKRGTELGGHRVPARIGSVPTPLVFGYPGKLLLPEEFSSWGPVDQRNAVAHELAHIRAKDPAWVVVFGVGKAVFWWHPIVRLLANCHRREIELAADQAVLASGVNPADYAQTLLTLAQPRRFAVGCPAAGVGPLEGRIRGALGFSSLSRRVPLFLVPTAMATAAIAIVGFADREVIFQAIASPNASPSVTVATTSPTLKQSSAVTVASSPKRPPQRRNRAKPTVSRAQTADSPDPISAESPASHVTSTDPVSEIEPAASSPRANPSGARSRSEEPLGIARAESPVETHPHPLTPLPRAGRGEIGEPRLQTTSSGVSEKSLSGAS